MLLHNLNWIKFKYNKLIESQVFQLSTEVKVFAFLHARTWSENEMSITDMAVLQSS